MSEVPEKANEKLISTISGRVATEEMAKTFARFLSEYAARGVFGLSCDHAGIRRATLRKWIKEFPLFTEKFDEIKEKFVDGLEQVAIERAKEKSDGLLMFLLKAHKREVYGDRQHLEVEAQQDINIYFNEGMLTDEEKLLLGGKKNGE